MRLSDFEQDAIRDAFKEFFLEGDKVWLFGSRVDDEKRGGDIDLYIETGMADYSDVRSSKIKFYVELCNKIGEQKIDIIVHQDGEEYKPIENIARETGVLL